VKSKIQYLLQRILGLQTYLFLFSWFKIKTLRSDKNENDFFHFLQLCSTDGNLLDIGANIGIMSYYLAKHTTGKVIAFEPIPQNVKTLERVQQFFGLDNLEIHPIALGNTEGYIDMVMPVVDDVKKQGLSHVLTDEIKTFNEGDQFEVPIQRLDDLAFLNDVQINAIKMDVENYEYQVLLGAVALLELYHPIIYCELWDNDNRYKCFDLLRDIGYSIRILERGSLKPYNDKKHQTQNFFFVFD
jgi:FkbM family methyltransferase